MIIESKKGTKHLVFVEVPKSANDFFLDEDTGDLCYDCGYEHVELWRPSEILKYKIIFKLSEAKEADWIDLIAFEGKSGIGFGEHGDDFYADYLNPGSYPFPAYDKEDIEKSWQSLLKAEGIDTTKEWVVLLKENEAMIPRHTSK